MHVYLSGMRRLPALALYCFTLFCLAGAGGPAWAQNRSESSLTELRRHTEMALARGDLRSAEMLIETYLPAVQRLADPTWHLFNGHLVASRIKLGLGKIDEAETHAEALRDIVSRTTHSADAMERAIAAIALAQVRIRQERASEAVTSAREAIDILNHAFQRGRITRRTFDSERLSYESVLIEATTAAKSARAGR